MAKITLEAVLQVRKDITEDTINSKEIEVGSIFDLHYRRDTENQHPVINDICSKMMPFFDPNEQKACVMIKNGDKTSVVFPEENVYIYSDGSYITVGGQTNYLGVERDSGVYIVPTMVEDGKIVFE